MCKACRQRSSWARIKLSSSILTVPTCLTNLLCVNWNLTSKLFRVLIHYNFLIRFSISSIFNVLCRPLFSDSFYILAYPKTNVNRFSGIFLCFFKLFWFFPKPFFLFFPKAFRPPGNWHNMLCDSLKKLTRYTHVNHTADIPKKFFFKRGGRG